MTKPFDTLRSALVAELHPADYAATPCPSYPGATRPVTGLQLWHWARVNEAHRHGYGGGLGGLVDSIAGEGRRRGFGGKIRGYSREQVSSLYPWAMEELRKVDEHESRVRAEWGEFKPEIPRRPR